MDSGRVSLMVQHSLWSSKKADARATMTINLADLIQMRQTMRTVFNIEVKCDLPIHDEQRRRTFVKLMMEATRKLYSQSTMLAAELSPEIMVTIEDNHGSREIHLFDDGEKEV